MAASDAERQLFSPLRQLKREETYFLDDECFRRLYENLMPGDI